MLLRNLNDRSTMNGKNTVSKPSPAPAASSPTLAPGDQLVKCIDAGKRPDCQGEFVFTAGEQAFYAEKGYVPTKRCKPCRDAKKLERQGGYNTSGGYTSGSDGAGSGGGARMDGYSDDRSGRGGGGGGGGKKRRRERDEGSDF
jgi:hypothetical protein